MTTPRALQPNDTIGLAVTSHLATREGYAGILQAVEGMGYRVKTAPHFYSASYGYLASEEERAEGFNALVRDPDVRMIFFGGGEGASELLPLLDYDAIAKNPKLIASYSDGTSVLNAITSKTRLVTYYGQTPGCLPGMTASERAHFDAHFVKGGASAFEKTTEWKACHAGVCEGELIGGYTRNFTMLVNGDYLRWEPGRRYILFLEERECFIGEAGVSMYLSHVEQCAAIGQISGLLFGAFADEPKPHLLARLARFGEKHDIPVVYCDDFGHGANHGILPIGRMAQLDADKLTLTYL